jgi:putative transposase
MDASEKLAREVGTAAACRAMGVARATFYRRRKPPRLNTDERPTCRQPRALDASERRVVLDLLHSRRFVDKAPAAVYATLLDEGTRSFKPPLPALLTW